MLIECTECGRFHCWNIVSDKFEQVCGACYKKPNIGVHPQTGQYVRFAYCTCGERGPINFLPNQYWCMKHRDSRRF